MRKKTTDDEREIAIKLIQRAQERIEDFNPFIVVEIAKRIQEIDSSVTWVEAIGESIQYTLDNYKTVGDALALRLDVDAYGRILEIFSYFDSRDFFINQGGK